jgi:hypothetical protein
MRRRCALAAILRFVGCSDDLAGPPSESGDVISLTQGRNDANIHFWLTLVSNAARAPPGQPRDLPTGPSPLNYYPRFTIQHY